MDFSALSGITDSEGIGAVPAAVTMVNDRSICYYVRGKTVAEVTSILENNDTFIDDTDFYCIADANTEGGITLGTYLFLDPDKRLGIEKKIYDQDDTTILESEHEDIPGILLRLENSTTYQCDIAIDTYVSTEGDYDNSEESEIYAWNAYDESILLKFDLSIIPSDLTILIAYVEFDVSEFAGSWKIHRMLIDWADTATYSSLTNGVSVNDVEAVSIPECINGTQLPGGDNGIIESMVSPQTIQDQIDGAIDNYGYVVQTPSGGELSISSNEASEAYRPKLIVTCI